MCTLPDSAFTVTIARLPDDCTDLSHLGDADNYKGEPPEDVAKYMAQDAERLDAYNGGKWEMVGVQVTIHRHGVKLCGASLWGIESDSGEAYFDEVAKDLTREALDDARKVLTTLCAPE